MKKTIGLFALLCLIALAAQAQLDTSALMQEAQLYQEEINASYADTASSPLEAEDLEHFEALPFFPISADFIVTARFEQFKKKELAVFRTSTSRMPSYAIYGKLYFEINGVPLELTLYQNPAFKKNKELKDHLFLPFTDLTNGETTYGGGRYLDFSIPPKNAEFVTLNFNKAYNPYCAYTDRYSCPVPPKNNFLDVEINAGVMLLEGH